MPAKREYTAEFKEQSVRFVFEHIEVDESRYAACQRLGPKLNVKPVTLELTHFLWFWKTPEQDPAVWQLAPDKLRVGECTGALLAPGTQRHPLSDPAAWDRSV